MFFEGVVPEWMSGREEVILAKWCVCVCVTKRSAPFEDLTEMVRMVVGLKLRVRKHLGDLGQQVVKWVLAEGRFLLGQTVLSYLV